jgi:hypothetical protein
MQDVQREISIFKRFLQAAAARAREREQQLNHRQVHLDQSIANNTLTAGQLQHLMVQVRNLEAQASGLVQIMLRNLADEDSDEDSDDDTIMTMPCCQAHSTQHPVPS